MARYEVLDRFHKAQKDAFHGYVKGTARAFGQRLCDVADRLGITLDGVAHLPAGRALLVANHAFGWDVAFAMALIERRTGRRVWALGEHAWWSVPFVRGAAAAVGVVDGTPENVDRLLDRDELVLVLPGGLREALKPRELRYRLLWGRRYGFVRAAIRNQTPMVPLASLGADEWFDWVGDPYQRGQTWLKPLGIPIPLPRPSMGIPRMHMVRPEYLLGAPVRPPATPEAEHDEEALRRTRREVEGALCELIDAALARRAGFPVL